MTEQKHSTTPWELCHHLESAEKDASCKCGYRGGIWGDAGELLVCEMRNCDLHEGHEMTPVGDRATQLANAHFIVRACNSHEALILALENARRDLLSLKSRSDTGSARDRRIEAAAARIAEALTLPSQNGKTP